MCLEIFSLPGRLIPTSQVDRLSSRATQIVVSWGWTGDEIRGAVSQVIAGLLGWLLATSAYQSSAVIHLHGISQAGLCPFVARTGHSLTRWQTNGATPFRKSVGG